MNDEELDPLTLNLEDIRLMAKQVIAEMEKNLKPEEYDDPEDLDNAAFNAVDEAIDAWRDIMIEMVKERILLRREALRQNLDEEIERLTS